MASHTMMRTAAILSVLIALASSTPLWMRPEDPKLSLQGRAYEDYALPSEIKPLEYSVQLLPFLDNAPTNKTDFTFEGKVTILFQVIARDVTTIRMHAFDIELDLADIKVTHIGGGVNQVISMTLSEDDRHFLDLELARPLGYGASYNLEISYLGKLNDNLEGFYRSKYTVDGVDKWMAVTQFEQNGARRAFPSFDEPIWKAKFQMVIAHAPGHTVLSNMPADELETPVENIPGLELWKWTHFAVTPVVMSSYLVAFTVSEFQSITHPDDDRYKVWARPGAQSQGQYANDLAPKIVSYMEDYTGHKYTFPKVDQIAIPDFAAGAMENWGLITYRESSLLFEEGVSGSSNRQRIEAVVTHELAHQWFGNIVSPTWWSHIWLSEGFATYFEYHALATVQTEWQLVNQFIYQEMHTVLQTDALSSTHPLVTEVDSPSSSSAAFDNIAYNKGGCMVRQMVNLMGEENFKAGINVYLTNMEFSNAEPSDLWAGLAPSAPAGVLPLGADFATVMNTWVEQSGYPVVTLTRNYATNTATAHQERFMTLKEEGVTYDEKWWVPLTFATQQDLDFENLSVKSWLSPTGSASVSVPATNKQWVICNNKQVGYYRVNYDATNWGLLSSALNDHMQMSKIHVINRGELMDDALALARAGLLDYALALDTTTYLWHEAEYHPWAVALAGLGYLNDRLNYEQDSRNAYEWYMLSKLGPAYELVNGFTVTEDDSHVMRYMRSLILKWACELGHEACNTEAASLFKVWQNAANPDTENPIEPDLKSVVYCAGMREGGQAEYDFLFARYTAASNVASEQALILTALGCASDTALLDSYLQESITEGGRIRRQDARSVHSSVYNNYLGVNLALDFIVENWETCVDFYGDSNNVGRAFTGVANKANTQAHRKQLDDLYVAEMDEATSAMDRTLHRTLLGAIKTVDETLGWHEQYRTKVVSYFKSKNTDSGAGLTNVSSLLLVLTVALSALLAKF